MLKFLTWTFVLLIIFAANAKMQNVVVSAELSAKKERAAGFVNAINSGNDKALSEFITANFTDDSLKQRPIEQRLPILKQIAVDIQGAVIKRVTVLNDNEINTVLQGTGGDWFTFHFTFDDKPPFRISTVGIQRTSEPGNEAATPRVAGPPISQTEAVVEIAKLFDDLSGSDEFSGVVLVAKDDKPLYAKAFGFANVETKSPNRIDTKFNIGSIDKLFTQIAIGILARQGKLSYDDKLAKFLPDYPNKEAAQKVTVKQLLNHTSGVGDIFGSEYQATPKDKLRNISDFIPLFAGKPLLFEPGTKQMYSNGGYILLGAVIEKVSGQSYYDFVRRNIFDPLKMSDTAFYESDKSIPNMAEGYTTKGIGAESSGKRQNNLFTRPARGSSAGGGYSTAQDLMKFSLAYQDGKIKVPDDEHPNADESASPAALAVAGGSPGVNALLDINPENRYTIIVMSNYDPRSAEKPARQVREVLLRVR